MKIMLIKDRKMNERISIPKGQVFSVREINENNVLGYTKKYYQIIDVRSPWSGELLPIEHCVEITNNPLKYTEKQYEDMESYYTEKLEKEREKNQRIIEITDKLTGILGKKNIEIEKLNFIINALCQGLAVSGEILRETRKNKGETA
jgi:hypothetical protein